MVRFPITAHTTLYEANQSFTVPSDVDVPRFVPGPEALSYLEREGYVVIENMNSSEVSRARELLWSFLEGTGAGVRRDAPETWIRSRPNHYGIVWHHGVGHSRLAWFIRTRPRLLEMFALVFGTHDLISSFEGFSWLPPTEYEAAWRLGEAWFHTDQNGVSMPGRQTVQSFTSLYDQDPTTGAFVVVPRSHKRHAQVTRRVYRAQPDTSPEQQFLMLPANDPVLSTPRGPHLVRVRAGDSVLWDSRTVHCSTPALHAAPPRRADPSESPRPNRVVVYNSLAPRRRADTATLRARQRALCTRQTCTHWPFLMACLEPPAAAGERPSDPVTHVLPIHKQLVGYTDEQVSRWLRADGHDRAREAAVGATAAVVCPPTADDRDDSTARAAAALFSTPHAVELAWHADEGVGGPRPAGKCLRRPATFRKPRGK